MPQSSFDEIIEKYVEMNIATHLEKKMEEVQELG